MSKPKDPICLNVGCHDIHIEGFVNVDLDPAMKPDLLADATKLLEIYDPGTVDYIYCGHFLEHLDLEVGMKVVQDFYSLLRPYGVVVAVVPDFSKCGANMAIEERERIIFAEGTHKVLMNSARLKDYFRKAGFLTVLNPSLGQDNLPHCLFPQVEWQSAILAMKHEVVVHRGPQ
jgi:predicted SAM-dependent methyltransferase